MFCLSKIIRSENRVRRNRHSGNSHSLPPGRVDDCTLFRIRQLHTSFRCAEQIQVHLTVYFRDSCFRHGLRTSCFCPTRSNKGSGNAEDRQRTSFLLRLTPKTPTNNAIYTPIEAARCQDKTMKTEWVLARAL